MEFSREVSRSVSPETLQSSLFISDLPGGCASIYEVMHDDGDTGEMNCLWGVFTVHREVIMGGLRFTLPECPNSVTWTIITNLTLKPDVIDIHCTLQSGEIDADFQQSVEEFMDDWKQGLENKFS